MVDTKKRNKQQNTWQAKNYDRINLTIRKGDREKIKQAAQACGTDVSKYIRECIAERMQKDCISPENMIHLV